MNRYVASQLNEDVVLEDLNYFDFIFLNFPLEMEKKTTIFVSAFLLVIVIGQWVIN